MKPNTFFWFFIPVLALLLLGLNLAFAPHSPYLEKSSTFECGFHSFLGQNRTQFDISFFTYGLLFLLFDLELLVIYPFVVTSYTNSSYGLSIMLIFFIILTMGFAFEIGKKALTIESKQNGVIALPSVMFIDLVLELAILDITTLSFDLLTNLLTDLPFDILIDLPLGELIGDWFDLPIDELIDEPTGEPINQPISGPTHHPAFDPHNPPRLPPRPPVPRWPQDPPAPAPVPGIPQPIEPDVSPSGPGNPFGPGSPIRIPN